MAGGDTCNKNSLYYTTYSFICNSNASTPIVNAAGFSINNCNNTITVTTSNACPQFDLYGLWNAIVANKYAFGTIILLGGLFLCFLGKKFMKVTEILTGVILVLLITLFFILSNINIALNTWQFWLAVGLSILAGIVAGYFIAQLEWLPPAILAGCVGFILGNVCFNIALKYIQSNPTTVYWVTMSVCIVLCVLLGIYFSTYVIILSTSIIGAYGMMRGLAIMIGYFPDERQVYQLMQNGEYDQVKALITWQVYLYMALFIILAILGIVIQIKYWHKEEEEEKKEKEAKLLDDRK